MKGLPVERGGEEIEEQGHGEQIYSTRQKKLYAPHRNYAVPYIKYCGVITLKRTVL